jgi:hypothetical protein
MMMSQNGKKDSMTHLFAQEITDFDESSVLLDDAVDREMSVYGTHFVSETLEYHEYWRKAETEDTYLGNTDHHVVDQGANGSQASDVFPAALPDTQSDHSSFVLHYPDIHVDMSDVLGQSSPGSSDCDKARFDGNIDAGGDFEFFGFVDVPHLEKGRSVSEGHPTKPVRIHPFHSFDLTYTVFEAAYRCMDDEWRQFSNVYTPWAIALTRCWVDGMDGGPSFG